MANIKITDLNAFTDPASTDVLAIVDVSADETKKVTIADLLENAGAGTAAAPAFAFDADPNTGMYRVGADQLGFATAGTGRLFIDSNGDVGIGVAAPADKMEILAATNGGLQIGAASGTGSIGLQLAGVMDAIPAARVRGYIGTTNSSGGIAGDLLIAPRTSTTASIRFVARGSGTPSEVMRVHHDGNVGIGTTSPGAKLHASSSYVTPSTGGIDASTALIVSNNNAASGEANISLLYRSNAKGRLNFGNQNVEDIAYVEGGPSYLAFGTGGGAVSADERLRIDSSGNVGIGTISPVYLVDAQGGRALFTENSSTYSVGVRNRASLAPNGNFWIGATNAISPDMVFSNNAGNERMRIADGGNVGIGTTAPSYLLDCKGTGATNVARFLTGSTSSSEVAQFGRIDQAVNLSIDYDGTGAMGIGTTTAHPLLLKTGATEKVRIDSSGRLLVGTDSESTAGNSQYAYIQIQGGPSGSAWGGIALRRNESATSITADEAIGQVIFADSTGNDFARVECYADGAAGSGDYPGRLAFSTSADGASSPTTSFVIKANGDLYMERSGTRFYVGGTAGAASIGQSSYAASSTTLYIGNAAIQVSSDARLKENIEETQLNALSTIGKIKVKDFTWNDPTDTSYNNRNARGKWTGLIAQELVEVLPFVVNAPRKEEDGSIDHESETTWTLDQSQLCPVLIKAIQEQQAIINDLEARLAALEAG